MVYDDDKTREREEDFQRKLEAARAFANEELPIIREAVHSLMADIDSMMEKQEKTPEDLVLLDKAEDMLQDALLAMQYAKNIIGQNLIKMSTAIYEGFRQEAAKGNEEARKKYEKLRPAYRAMLQEQLNNRQQ